MMVFWLDYDTTQDDVEAIILKGGNTDENSLSGRKNDKRNQDRC